MNRSRLFAGFSIIAVLGLASWLAVAARHPVARSTAAQSSPRRSIASGRRRLSLNAEGIAEANNFKPERTVAYLNARAEKWRSEHGCISCHSAQPYLLAQSALNPGVPSATAIQYRQLIVDRLRHGDAAPPWYDSSAEKAAESRSIESVMNASSLVAFDAASRAASLTPETRQALDRMMTLQEADGSWLPLNFSLQPWEARDSRLWTTATAAIALGSAADQYSASPSTDPGAQKVRAYLKSASLDSGLNLHDRLMLLWAEARLGSILGSSIKQSYIDAVLETQTEQGGFDLDRFGSWKKSGVSAADKSDGYTTGLAVLVLRQSGLRADHAKIRKATIWLLQHQGESGDWPGTTLDSSIESDDEAVFNNGLVRDAGAAYALMALDSVGSL